MSIQVPHWLLTGDESRSCLHSSRTRRVRTLKVRWRLYYEFMCFDVPKVLWSPRWDQGHDKESRNVRDIKIDILEGYIRTSERFRVFRVFFRVRESYENSYWALMGHTGKERKGQKGGRTPPHGLVRIGLGRGGAPFLPSPSPFPSPTPYGRWNPTRTRES